MRSRCKQCRVVLLSVLIPSGLSLLWLEPNFALTRRGPLSVELTVNRATSAPTVDLPPLNQRPTLYAELELDGQTITTDQVDTPQIGSSVYPDWSLRVQKEAVWLERGHPISAAVRIFDHDPDDADDKVLLTSLDFDPIACMITIGATTVMGDRQGSTCTVTLFDVQGKNGSARITTTAQW